MVLDDADEFLLLSAPLPWLLLDAVVAADCGVRADNVDDDDTFTVVAGVVVVVVVAADMAIVLMTAGTAPIGAAVVPGTFVLVVVVEVLLLLLIEEFVVPPAAMELLLTTVSPPTLPVEAAVLHVRSVTSPEVDGPSCCASLPVLSGALGCPSSGEGAIVRFRQRFHYRPGGGSVLLRFPYGNRSTPNRGCFLMTVKQ